MNNLIYVFLILVCVVSMVGMCFHVHNNSILSKKSKWWFTFTFVGIAVAATAELLGVTLDSYSLPPIIHTFVTLIEFSVTPLIPVLVSIACDVVKPAKPVGILMLVHAAIEVIMLPFGGIYSIDANGIYHRGDFYVIYIGSYVISFAYLMFMFLFLSRRFKNRDIVTLGFSVAAVLAGLVPSIIDGKIRTAFLGLTVASIMLYNYYEGLTQQDLSEELAIKNANIQELQDKMIIGIADLIDSRDSNTGTHVKNTSRYVRILCYAAREANLYPEVINDEFVANVIQAAPMHDVGKIAVPDAILRKPSGLTDEEFQIMKSHAAEGGKVINKILDGATNDEYTKVAYDVASYHHEKWDGSGYPNGLSGEDIPMSARIMAIADVYDALTMERAYKKAFSKEKALSIIEEGAGTHFDPVLAPVFAKVMREL